MENYLVILIIVLAGAYIIRSFYERVKKQRGCGCGCSSCDMDMTDGDPEKDHAHCL